MPERKRSNQRRPYPRPDQPARGILLARGLSVGAVARHAGVSKSLVAGTLYGRNRPNPRVVAAIEALTGEPRSALLHPEDA